MPQIKTIKVEGVVYDIKALYDSSGNEIASTYATNTAVNNKVDKVDGKGLSANDYTTVEKTKLSGIEAEANKTTLSTSVTSTSTTTAATSSAVKSAYDRGSSGISKADTAQSRADSAWTLANAKWTYNASTIQGVKVDNAEKVNGFTVGTNVPANAKFTDTVYTHPETHPASIITQTEEARFVSDAEKLAWNDKVDNSRVLTDVPENAKFTDTIYTHPTGTNPHGTTKEDVGLGNVTNTSDADKPVSTAQLTAINSGVADAKTYADEKSALAIPLTQKGVASGVAELDAEGIILSSQLPSYVDDVLEFATLTDFPATGESGKIYVTISTNLTYRWTGTTYVEISPSIALGETTATAYRGDRGKAAYDHSQTAHAPSDAQKNSDITKAEIEDKLIGVVDSHSHTVTKAGIGLGNVDDIQQATKIEFNEHNVDAVKHITATERTAWNAKGSSNLVLGDTSVTAYRGDLGAIAYDHSQSTHAPTNAQKNSDITKAEIEAKLTGAITTHTHSTYVPTSRTVAGKALTGNITLAKGDVGLGNVDNTSDADKPVSTAQAAAIALKIDASKFQVVEELPASPVEGVFYFIKK